MKNKSLMKFLQCLQAIISFDSIFCLILSRANITFASF
ncbi:hypothetical protein SLEP1_g24684 [Rubroshorea leprosula]|uniref:Uncharacterized protein n=1 Tax=Rubroshorea leprosula TaxID=152421 RepID=A0AAV5JQV4_9ROSI|nr:hypothetical protein SLEP1_g24684 [Rubroshorea leprosula]